MAPEVGWKEMGVCKGDAEMYGEGEASAEDVE